MTIVRCQTVGSRNLNIFKYGRNRSNKWCHLKFFLYEFMAVTSSESLISFILHVDPFCRMFLASCGILTHSFVGCRAGVGIFYRHHEENISEAYLQYSTGC